MMYRGSTHHFVALCAIYHTQRCSMLYTQSLRQSQDLVTSECRRLVGMNAESDAS